MVREACGGARGSGCGARRYVGGGGGDAPESLGGERHGKERVDELLECQRALLQKVPTREEGDGIGALQREALEALTKGDDEDRAPAAAVDLSEGRGVRGGGARLQAEGGDHARGGDGLGEQLGGVLELLVARLFHTGVRLELEDACDTRRRTRTRARGHRPWARHVWERYNGGWLRGARVAHLR